MEVYIPGSDKIIHNTMVDFGTRALSNTVHFVQHDTGIPISCSNASYVFATPIVTELTPGELNTFPRYTHISQDGEVKTYMNPTTKVQD